MPKFRKKPVVIEALLFDGSLESLNAIALWARKAFIATHSPGAQSVERITIPTLEGELFALPGDWIIRGVKGEFYPCKPDIFEATYESAE